MKLVILAIGALLSGCATPPRRQIEIIGQIERSSVRVVAKKNAPDGSRANGVVAFLEDSESPIAQAAAEQYCSGPVIVHSEDYLATGDVNVDTGVVGWSDLWGNTAFASTSAKQKRAWKMVFDCNKTPSEKDVETYRMKFAKTVNPGPGDWILGKVGLR